MQDTRPTAPWLRAPFIGIIVDGFHVRVVQQGRVDGLLFALAAEKVFGGLGQDDADADFVAVVG